MLSRLAIGVWLLWIWPATANAVDPRTNFVIVLCDDLGYGDLRCYGNDQLQTPNVDRFAAEGIRFTQCYAAAANCSPARTGMMTGRTPYRAGIYTAIPFLSPMHLRPSEITVASLLRAPPQARPPSRAFQNREVDFQPLLRPPRASLELTLPAALNRINLLAFWKCTSLKTLKSYLPRRPEAHLCR